MDFNAIWQRAIAVLIKPNQEWVKIKDEPASVADVYLKYGIFLAAIPSLAGLIGYSMFGISVGVSTFRIPLGRSLSWAVFTYIFNLAGSFIMAVIIDQLAPNFGAKKDMTGSVKLVVYAYTAAWAAGVLHIIPALTPLITLISLYSLYLMYLGMKTIKAPPADKLTGYLVVTLIIAFVVAFVMMRIAGTISFGGAWRFFA